MQWIKGHANYSWHLKQYADGLHIREIRTPSTPVVEFVFTARRLVWTRVQAHGQGIVEHSIEAQEGGESERLKSIIQEHSDRQQSLKQL